MTDCAERLDFDEWWFVCQLEADHDGRHRYSGEAEAVPDSWLESRRRANFVIEWDSSPATVAGSVVTDTPTPTRQVSAIG